VLYLLLFVLLQFFYPLGKDRLAKLQKQKSAAAYDAAASTH
jgi:hypothetical protein